MDARPVSIPDTIRETFNTHLDTLRVVTLLSPT